MPPHLRIARPVIDLARSAKLYRDGLGLELLGSFEDHAGFDGVMLGVPGGRWGFLAVSIVAFIVLGMVLEGIPALVVFAPLLFPIARSFGIHDVQYAMVVILAMGVGVFAPPMGIGFFIACAIGKVPPSEAMCPMWPYLGALVAGLLLVAAVPWISTGFL